MNIRLVANPHDAPCCIKIVAEDGRDRLVQADWDFSGVASTFGWNPVRAQAPAARQWIDAHDGAEVEDPGYFD